MAEPGNLFIVSGPSGAGKSLLSARVLESVPNLHFSVSYTTRAPRGNEAHGVDYYFVGRDEFQSLVSRGLFLEWAEVYGNYYGTSGRFIEETIRRGGDVLLDIDVQGAEIIKRKKPNAISVFVLPPSYEVLRERLESRKLDKDYVIEQRLRIACQEIRQYAEYEFLVINDELSRSVEELKVIILGSRCRMSARAERPRAIVATFGGLDAENP